MTNKAPDYLRQFQLYALIVAYDLWHDTEKYKPKGRPGPPTLPERLEGVMACMRQGAKVFIENPRYRSRKAVGGQILEALKDADPAVLAKKYKAKAQRHWRSLFERCPPRPLSNLKHEEL